MSVSVCVIDVSHQWHEGWGSQRLRKTSDLSHPGALDELPSAHLEVASPIVFVLMIFFLQPRTFLITSFQWFLKSGVHEIALS